MENSHRRILAELDEKHRQELSQLRVEKEQALAEETQATLAGILSFRFTYHIFNLIFSRKNNHFFIFILF